MKKYLFYLPLLVSLFFTACSKDDQKDIIEPITPGKYADGFFIINEGWFGHENGSVNFYKYGEDTIRTNVFKKKILVKNLVLVLNMVLFSMASYILSQNKVRL